MGPDQGRYSVEVGFPGAQGGELWVHLVSDAGQAAAYFSAAYQHRKIDFTGFEKEDSDPRAADRRKQNGTQQTSSGLGGV